MRRLSLTYGWIALLLLACGCMPRSDAQSAPLQDLATFPRTTLTIHTAHGAQRFTVWVAATEARREQGLMFVRDLPADEGMLFIEGRPYRAAMWMKNTFIPLDMLFIAPDGRIAKIAANTTPQSLATIRSDAPVSAVLEIKGGEAARRKLHAGDRVSWQPPGARKG